MRLVKFALVRMELDNRFDPFSRTLADGSNASTVEFFNGIGDLWASAGAFIGLDIAKSVFQAHRADPSGGVVFRKKINRAKLLEFFGLQPPCTLAMEACTGAHHWAREMAKLGHEVKLIAPKDRLGGSGQR
jgi:hypothetical protein